MSFKHPPVNAVLLGVLLVFLVSLVSLSAYNTYLYLTKIRDIQNSLVALQDKNKDPGPRGLAGALGLEGPRGIQGYPGPKGDTGAPGVQGVTGIPGAEGQVGATGSQGPVGPQGETGPKGDPGDPGQSGRETEFRCDPDNNNYEWRYVGDETWDIIQKDSNACKSSPL